VLCVEHHDALDPNVDHSIEVEPPIHELGKAGTGGFLKQANSIAVAKSAWEYGGYVRVWASRVNSIFVNKARTTRSNRPRRRAVEGQYDYDAYGCKRDWRKVDNPKISLILSQPRLCFTDHSDRLIELAARHQIQRV
jgi:hypothetical protein